MPRARTKDGDAEIWPTATKEEIAQGFRMVPDFLFSGKFRRQQLRDLHASNYLWVRHHFFRKRGGKRDPLWIFTTYDDETRVNWIQFDFDRHYTPGMTADEKAEGDHFFHEQVRLLQGVADEQNFDIIWTTSPGDLDPFDGRHIQGLYGWIKLDRHIRVADLRRFIEPFKEMNLLDIECCWSTKHRNIRLPGQEFVELADPETVTILHPVKKQQREALGHFALAWQASRPADAARLFKEPLAWSRAQQKKMLEKAAKTAASIHQSTPASGKTKSSARHWKPAASVPDKSALIAQPNTFLAATTARICSLLTRKYRADQASFEMAVQEGMDQLRVIRPATSKTCGDPNLLRSTMTRWMNWYYKGYRPDRRSTGARASDRDIDDKKRIDYCLGLDRSRILRRLNNLSYAEKAILSKFLDCAEKWNYRVAVKVIYDGDEAICSKPEWFSLLRKTKGILMVVDQKDVENHRCRQWALAPWFVEDMKDAEVLVASVLQDVEREEKKKKEVYGWHEPSAVQDDPTLALCGSNTSWEASWKTITNDSHDHSSNLQHHPCALKEATS